MTERHFTRREALSLTTVGLAGAAGCLGIGESSTPAPESGGDATPTPEPVSELCESNPTVEGDDPLLVDFHAREEYRCAGQPLDNMEDLDRWEALEGTLTADADRSVTGTQSARLAAATSEERVSISRTFPDGVDFSERNPSMAVNIGADAEPFGVYFQLFAPNVHNRVDMWHGVGQSGWYRLDFGPTEVVGNPNLTDVREVRITSWAGDLERSFAVDSIRTTPRADQGYVVLTFDDGLISHYDEAYATMQEFDFPGVAAVMPDAVGRDGRMSLEQIEELHAAEWDVVSHPQESDPLPLYPPNEQERLLRENKQWLRDQGFERGSRFVIWPYGAAGAQTRDIGGRYHYLGFADGGGPSGVPFTDPMTVSRVNGDEVEETKRTIEFAAAYNQVAVPRFHPITTDEGRISPDAFHELMEFIDETDVEVVSASTLWDDVIR